MLEGHLQDFLTGASGENAQGLAQVPELLLRQQCLEVAEFRGPTCKQEIMNSGV